jgi:hypothetical protein
VVSHRPAAGGGVCLSEPNSDVQQPNLSRPDADYVAAAQEFGGPWQMPFSSAGQRADSFRGHHKPLECCVVDNAMAGAVQTLHAGVRPDACGARGRGRDEVLQAGHRPLRQSTALNVLCDGSRASGCALRRVLCIYPPWLTAESSG